MQSIHLEFEGKAARLPLQSIKAEKPALNLQRRTPSGLVRTARVFNGTSPVDPATLSADALVSGDPELDLAHGGLVADTDLLSPAFLDSGLQVVRDFEEVELILAADGTEKERRARLIRRPNVDELYPVKVGKLMPLDTVLTGFVFRSVLQIVHEDGVGYEFLLALARKLESAKVAGVLGAGPKGNLPLVFREKGSPYRAFLAGQTGSGADADKYRLLVLLSNQELKMPA